MSVKNKYDNYTPDLFSDTPDEVKKDILPVHNTIITFGKHKDEPIENLATDISYCQYLLSQSWFKQQHFQMYNFIINNICVQKDTPEHNKLQIKFNDDKLCLALGKLCNWKLMNKNRCIRNLEKAKNKLKHDNFTNYNNNFDKIEEIEMKIDEIQKEVYDNQGVEYTSYSNEPLFKVKKIFETDGWDVIISTDDENQNSTNCKIDCMAYKYCSIQKDKIAVEIKPNLGDDYTLIYRQMKNTTYHPYYQCLVYEHFTSAVTTLEEIKKMFATADIKVFSMAEIEKAWNELLLFDDQQEKEQGDNYGI